MNRRNDRDPSEMCWMSFCGSKQRTSAIQDLREGFQLEKQAPVDPSFKKKSPLKVMGDKDPMGRVKGRSIMQPQHPFQLNLQRLYQLSQLPAFDAPVQQAPSSRTNRCRSLCGFCFPRSSCRCEAPATEEFEASFPDFTAATIPTP